MSPTPIKKASKSTKRQIYISKPYYNWKKSSKSCCRFIDKNTFISKLFNRKLQKYLSKVCTNLKMKMYFSGLEDFGSKLSYILLMMKETLEFAMSRTNELINYKNSRSSKTDKKRSISLSSLIK